MRKQVCFLGSWSDLGWYSPKDRRFWGALPFEAFPLPLGPVFLLSYTNFLRGLPEIISDPWVLGFRPLHVFPALLAKVIFLLEKQTSAFLAPAAESSLTWLSTSHTREHSCRQPMRPQHLICAALFNRWTATHVGGSKIVVGKQITVKRHDTTLSKTVHCRLYGRTLYEIPFLLSFDQDN